MTAYTLVHFDGPWTTDDCERIVQAVSQFEASRPNPFRWTGYGKPWVAILCRVSGEPYYIANRQGMTYCMKGRSALELARKLYSIARSNAGALQAGGLD